jgi:hypothetical protein
LHKIIKNNPWEIKEFIAKDLLKEDDIIVYLKDLLTYWCQSWMASSMIRYTDTYRFFNTYYEEILEIVDDLQEAWIEVFKFAQYNLKNRLAWLCYEEVARDILTNDLGLDF